MTEILNQFREDDLPPSRVDIARAVRSGRRRRRVHAGLVAGGLVLVLAAGGATAPVWLSAIPDGRGSVTAAACTGGPLPAYTKGVAWQTFDPLIYEIDASAVTGYQLSGFGTGRYVQMLTLTNATETRRVDVTLYATEGVPYYEMPHTSVPTPEPGAVPITTLVDEPIDPAAGQATDPVGGAPAYWLPDQGVPNGQYGLAWQWTLGGWAFVTARALDPTMPKQEVSGDPTELRAIATQVASQLVLGSGTPVTSPFSMPVPDCTRVDDTALVFDTKSDGTPTASFVLGFAFEAQQEPSNPPWTRGNDPMVRVEVDTFAPAGAMGPATAEVDGYPAYNPQSNFLVVYGPLTVQISTPGSPEGMNTAAPSLVDPRAVYSSVQLRPGATADPATWGPPIA